MASESVKKILAAEADSEKKNSEAKKRRDEIINEAAGRSSQAVQKRLALASLEAAKMRNDIKSKAEQYRMEAERTCDDDIDLISSQAQKNMDKAISAVIERFF